ncbi:unnamed protein product [Malus baccata var. baccata]
MARVIISEKSPGHPEKWSRLWNPQEVTNVLENEFGTEEVEGLALDNSFSHDKSSFSTEAFAKMKKLRLLQLNNVKLNGEYKHLPKELVWLCWHRFPLESIPDDFFNQPRLVVLEMQYSQLVQLWEGSKSLQKLKIIHLKCSHCLTKSPNFSQVPNLEELILEHCVGLSEIHPSIGHLKKLSLVNLQGCKVLISLPRDFYKSTSVETLYLNNCSNFRELHEDLGGMTSLRILEANLTSIRRVPPSIVRLKNLTRLSLHGVKSIHLPSSLHGLNSLRELDLSFCELADDPILKDLGSLISLQHLDLEWNNLHTLPRLSGLSKLETLRLSGCKYLHTIPDLPTNLKFLYAFNCPALESMPNFSEMSNMRELKVSNSTKLIEVPGLDKSLHFMTWINMQMCPNLTADFRKNILQGWTSCGLGGISLHGNYIPDWLEFVNDGNKVSFNIPLSDDRNFEGLTVLCIYRSGNRIDRHLPLDVTVINNTKRTMLRAYIGITDWEELVYEDDYLWQGQLSNDKLNLQGGDKVDIIFEDSFASLHPDYYVTMKKTGVNLVWDKLMMENMHDLDEASYVFDPHPARFYDASDNNHPIIK